MKLFSLFAIFLINIICVFEVAADHPSVAFGTEASGPIGTIAATPMPLGKWAIGLRTELINSDQFADDKLANYAEQGIEDVHSIDHLYNSSIAVAYGVTKNLTISIRIPWISRNNIREGEFDDDHAEGDAHGHGDASGLGDSVFLANYRVWEAATFDASLQAGFKAPTGDVDESDRGQRLETEFQPGTGSWDFLIGGSASKTIGQWGLHTNILYSGTSEGSQNTEIGNALFYNAAAVFTLATDSHHEHSDGRVHPHLKWDVMLELNGEKRWENEINGATEINSGGDIVYLSPGVRMSYRKMGVFLSAGFPIIDDTNGIQTDVDFRLLGGLGFTF